MDDWKIGGFNPTQFFENREVMNVSEVSNFLGVSEKTVRKKVGERAIPFKRMGRRILFLKSEILRWLTKE